MLTLLNTIFTKQTGIDLNIWLPFLWNKIEIYGPFVGNKIYNGILITSPYFGYTFYTAAGFTLGLKLAEYGVNYKYFLNKTVEGIPVVSQVSWGITKVRNVFSKETVVESTQIEYYPLFNNVISKLNLDKISITFDSQNISPVVPVNSPAPSVSNTESAFTTTTTVIATTTNPETLLEPQMQPQAAVPETPVVVLPAPEVQQQPVPQIRERVIYKDRENVAEFKNYLLSLEKEVRNSNVVQIEARLGRQNIETELSNLSFFNTKDGFNPNLYQNNKEVRRSFDLEDVSLVLPQISRIEFRFVALRSRGFSSMFYINLPTLRKQIAICFNKTDFELLMDPAIFGEHFPSILSILDTSFTKNQHATRFKGNTAVLEIKHKIENASGWFKKISIDSENCMFYFLNQNDTPIPFLEKAYQINRERAGISNSKLDSTRLLIENFILNSTFSDFEVFLTKKFGSVAVRQEIKSFLGAFENQRLKTIMPNNIVEIPAVLVRLAQEEREVRLKQIEEIKNLIKARRVARIQEQAPIIETQPSIDLASPLVLGSIGLSSALAQLVAVLNGTPLLENHDTVNLLVNLYSHFDLPLPEILRTVQPVTEVVQNTISPETGVSTTTMNTSSISSVSVSLTETFSTYIPSLKSVAIGVGIVGAVACAVYGIKYGVGVNVSDIKEATTAVIQEDYSQYMKIKTLK